MTRKVSSNKQIQLGAIMSYITITFNVVSGLLYTPWMVKQIGQSDYGLYTLSVSLISFFAMDFGLGPAVSRFLSKYKATKDKEGEENFLGIVFKLFAIIGLIIFCGLIFVYFLIENIYVELTFQEIEKLRILYLITGLFTIVSFPFKPFDGILIANERFAFIRSVDLIQKILTVILLVTALSLGYSLYAIVIVNAFTGIMSVLLKYVYIRKKTKTEVNLKYREKGLYLEVFKFSSWTTIITVSQRFILNIAPTILGAFAGSSEIALFSVGMTIEGYMYTFSHAFGGLFLPKVTKIIMNEEDNVKQIENLLIKVGRIQFLIIGLIIAGFIAMGHEFTLLWMGQDFITSYYVALLLIAPGIITLTFEIANTALIAKNEIKYRAISSVIVATISVTLSIPLSQYYGAVGSAMAICIGTIIGSVIFMSNVYQKVLGINMFKFFKECHLKMGTPFFVTLLVGTFVQRLYPVTSLLPFMVKAIFLAGVYGMLMWTIVLHNYEKEMFKGLFSTFSKRS